MYLRDTSKPNHVIHVDTFLSKEEEEQQQQKISKKKKNYKKKTITKKQNNHQQQQQKIQSKFYSYFSERNLPLFYRYRLTFISEMQSQCRIGKRPNTKATHQPN